jgi:hypothetical protein
LGEWRCAFLLQPFVRSGFLRWSTSRAHVLVELGTVHLHPPTSFTPVHPMNTTPAADSLLSCAVLTTLL